MNFNEHLGSGYSIGEYLVELLDTLKRIADALENKTRKE